MKTRCKFQVQKVSKVHWSSAEEIKLAAVYGTDGENKSFSEATPSGDLTILVTNPSVIGTFALGAYYYLDLIPAE